MLHRWDGDGGDGGEVGWYYDNNLNFCSRRHGDDRQQPRHRQPVFVSPELPFSDAEFK